MFFTHQSLSILARKRVAGGDTIVGHPTLTTGLITYYKADDNTTDAHGSNDATFTAATYDTGIINNGFELDGVNDLVETGVTPDVSNFSIAMWVKLDAIGTQQGFATCLSAISGRDGWFFLKYTDNTFSLSGYNGNSYQGQAQSSGTLTTGWHHIVGTVDGTEVKVYLDGALEDTNSSVTGVSVIDRDWVLGRQYGDSISSTLAGVEDEVGFWDKTLTADEVSDLYNSGDGLPYN